MSVVARFRVQSISRTLGTSPVKQPDGRVTYEPRELQTISLTPVTSSDPDSVNGKFFGSTPSGKIDLGTLNAVAGSYFDLNGEYEILFTKVEDGAAPRV